MNLTPKAFIFANEQEQAFVQLFKQFLFRCGMRETAVVQDPLEISKYVFDDVWPLVFIDVIDGISDGFAVFEGLYKTTGYQLFPYVIVAPGEKKVYELFAQSAGAAGTIRKPLQVIESEKLLKRIIPNRNDPATLLALQVSRLLLRSEFEKAMAPLARLAAVPAFKRNAEIALVRCEIGLGHISKAESRIKKMMQANPREIRVLCELADFLRRNAQYADALKCCQRIREMHPQMNIKVWDQIILHHELDQLDEAANLLESLQGDPTFKELSSEGLARMMLFMGMADYIPQFLKACPNALKSYTQFLSGIGKIAI